MVILVLVVKPNILIYIFELVHVVSDIKWRQDAGCATASGARTLKCVLQSKMKEKGMCCSTSNKNPEHNNK